MTGWRGNPCPTTNPPDLSSPLRSPPPLRLCVESVDASRRSGEHAAQEEGLFDAAEGEDVGALAQGGLVPLGDGGHLAEGAGEDAAQALVDLVLLPEEGLEVLHPLEVG